MLQWQEISKRDNTRLYDLLVGFKQGDNDCFESIIRRFANLINKASHNNLTGKLDEDLRSEIYITLFRRFSRFVIPDSKTLAVMAASQ